MSMSMEIGAGQPNTQKPGIRSLSLSHILTAHLSEGELNAHSSQFARADPQNCGSYRKTLHKNDPF